MTRDFLIEILRYLEHRILKNQDRERNGTPNLASVEIWKCQDAIVEMAEQEGIAIDAEDYETYEEDEDIDN